MKKLIMFVWLTIVSNSLNLWKFISLPPFLFKLPINTITITFIFLLFLGNELFPYTKGNDNDSINSNLNKPRPVYYAAQLTTDPPVIDGTLNDECWKTGNWAGNFTQRSPNEGGKPSQATELKILYDNYNIYAAVRAYDKEPDKIIRKAGRRDEFNGDGVGINFDSYHDHRTGFEFDVTAAGQKIDLLLTNPTYGDFNWNAVWYVKAGMEDSAWVAEYQIPLSQLRYSGDDEQVWGMHCWRWIDRLREESEWEPQSDQGPGMLYLFGELRGIKGLPPSRRIEIMPYTLGKLNTFKTQPDNPFANRGKSWLGNLGLDAKIGLSSNFTADLTINPDFGQVEADPSVMNLTAFETFFDEKRPFFLEGKNIFSFDFDNCSIFYSRRIGHAPGYLPSVGSNEYLKSPDNTTILSALKLSGKTSDGLAIGILQSLTSNEKAKFNSEGITRNINVEPLTNYTIVRVQKDYNGGNTVLGGIVTSTNRFIKNSNLEFMNRNAFTGGFDLLHYWNDKEFFVNAKLAGSQITGAADAIRNLQTSSARYYQRPDADYLSYDSSLTRLSGYGGNIKAGKGSKGSWRYSAEINWRSPGLDLNDLGFMQTSDIIKQTFSLSYFVTHPVSIFRTYNIGVSQTNNWDFGMHYLSSGGSINLYLEFLNKWSINNSLNYTSEALDTRILRGGYSMLVPAVWSNYFYVCSNPSGKLFFDLSTGVSLSEQNRSRYYYLTPQISFMPMNILKISTSINYSSNIDKLQYVDAKAVNSSDKYIFGKINQHSLGVTFRIDYYITPEFTIQFYGSPFASVGKYSDFKIATNPRAVNYSGRFSAINPALNGNKYDVTEYAANETQQIKYSFENPDFNFSQFRSNLVLRWEYRPGSQVYIVWSNERTYYVKPGDKSVKDVFSLIKDVYPNNIFLIKFNYWFTI